MTGDNPVPRMKRNSTGWTSDVTMRTRARKKRISSRRQTTLTARRSSAREPPASRTATTGAVWTAIALPPHPAAHERRASHLIAGRRLSIANRAAGIGHEHIIERGACHTHRADRYAQLREEPRHKLFAARHEEGHRALADRRVDTEMRA